MRRFSAAGVPLLLLLIITGFFWKLLTKQYTWMDQPDMAYQVLPGRTATDWAVPAGSGVSAELAAVSAADEERTH
ncbi:MAG TPA: hypothetical protein VLY24_28515 [Bryobacteraceae bacterium]|nr:hypothetical protein [Bryobacteraceae bacterium]